MNKPKMSPEELNAESLRLRDLIDKGSEAELRGVEEMSKHPLSLEQMREQVRRQHAGPGWIRSPIPSGDKNDSE